MPALCKTIMDKPAATPHRAMYSMVVRAAPTSVKRFANAKAARQLNRRNCQKASKIIQTKNGKQNAPYTRIRRYTHELQSSDEQTNGRGTHAACQAGAMSQTKG